MAPETTGQQDLRTYLRIFWRWKLLFLAFVVLIPLGVYLYERSKPNIYQSSTLVEFANVSTQSGSVSVAPVASGNLAAISRLVTTTPVTDTAARLLGLPPAAVSGEVTSSADTDTGFLTISAQDRDPNRAAAIANAVAEALAHQNSAQVTTQINQQVAALRRQLATTPRSQPGARITLEQQITQTQALSAATGAGVQVVQAATPSGTPVSPKTRRNVELALVIALLLGVGAVLLAEHADRRVRAPEDIEAMTGWPLLASIPPSAFLPDHAGDPRNEESFQMLRTALTYFNVERPMRSVAIISPLVGDGKTTVAVGLAIAIARAGKRAILLDADLRRPGVSGRLGIDDDAAGLGAVLAGERQLGEVMQECPVEAADGGRLLVLAAGPPPPNPAALLDSQKMHALVQELEQQADMVVIDSVAALALSDALPLLSKVSGSVVIARMNRSSRAAVRRLQKMIGSAGGTVLGVVATGSATGGGYGTYYPYYEDGRPPGALGRLRLRRRSPASANGAVSVSETPEPDPASVQAPSSEAPDGRHD